MPIFTPGGTRAPVQTTASATPFDQLIGVTPSGVEYKAGLLSSLIVDDPGQIPNEIILRDGTDGGIKNSGYKLQNTPSATPTAGVVLDENAVATLIATRISQAGAARTQKGTWNAATNTPTLTTTPSNVTFKVGDFYEVTTAGTALGITWAVGDLCLAVLDASNVLRWVKLQYPLDVADNSELYINARIGDDNSNGRPFREKRTHAGVLAVAAQPAVHYVSIGAYPESVTLTKQNQTFIGAGTGGSNVTQLTGAWTAQAARAKVVNYNTVHGVSEGFAWQDTAGGHVLEDCAMVGSAAGISTSTTAAGFAIWRNVDLTSNTNLSQSVLLRDLTSTGCTHYVDGGAGWRVSAGNGHTVFVTNNPSITFPTLAAGSRVLFTDSGLMRVRKVVTAAELLTLTTSLSNSRSEDGYYICKDANPAKGVMGDILLKQTALNGSGVAVATAVDVHRPVTRTGTGQLKHEAVPAVVWSEADGKLYRYTSGGVWRAHEEMDDLKIYHPGTTQLMLRVQNGTLEMYDITGAVTNVYQPALSDIRFDGNDSAIRTESGGGYDNWANNNTDNYTEANADRLKAGNFTGQDATEITKTGITVKDGTSAISSITVGNATFQGTNAANSAVVNFNNFAITDGVRSGALTAKHISVPTYNTQADVTFYETTLANAGETRRLVINGPFGLLQYDPAAKTFQQVASSTATAQVTFIDTTTTALNFNTRTTAGSTSFAGSTITLSNGPVPLGSTYNPSVAGNLNLLVETNGHGTVTKQEITASIGVYYRVTNSGPWSSISAGGSSTTITYVDFVVDQYPGPLDPSGVYIVTNVAGGVTPTGATDNLMVNYNSTTQTFSTINVTYANIKDAVYALKTGKTFNKYKINNVDSWRDASAMKIANAVDFLQQPQPVGASYVLAFDGIRFRNVNPNTLIQTEVYNSSGNEVITNLYDPVTAKFFRQRTYLFTIPSGTQDYFVPGSITASQIARLHSAKSGGSVYVASLNEHMLLSFADAGSQAGMIDFGVTGTGVRIRIASGRQQFTHVGEVTLTYLPV